MAAYGHHMTYFTAAFLNSLLAGHISGNTLHADALGLPNCTCPVVLV